MHLFRLTYGSPRFSVSICIPHPQLKLTIGPPTTIRKLRPSCSQWKPRIVTDIVTLLLFHQAMLNEKYGDMIRQMREEKFKVRYSWTRFTRKKDQKSQKARKLDANAFKQATQQHSWTSGFPLGNSLGKVQRS